MDLTQFPNLVASPQAREVVAAALDSGEADIAWRDGVAWYVDPAFGEDVPVSALSYDPELGLYVPKAERSRLAELRSAFGSASRQEDFEAG